MARGYPDFFGVPIFPEYGPNYLQYRLVAAVAFGAREAIFELTQKALVRGGQFYITGVATATGLILDLEIDGQSVIATLSGYPSAHLTAQFPDWPIECRYYNLVEEKVTFGFKSNMPIGSSFKVILECGDAGGYGVEGYLWYTNIV